MKRLFRHAGWLWALVLLPVAAHAAGAASTASAAAPAAVSADWKTYDDGVLRLRYPPQLLRAHKGSAVTLQLSIPYRNEDACSDLGMTDRLQLFGLALRVVAGTDVADNAQPVQVGRWQGRHRYYSFGAEGCGQDHYYFPLGNSHMLEVERPAVRAFSRAGSAEKLAEIQRTPGAISRDEADRLFQNILSTVEVAPVPGASAADDARATAGWKTYQDAQLRLRYPPRLTVARKGQAVTLALSIRYPNSGDCDMNEPRPSQRLQLFGLSLRIVGKSQVSQHADTPTSVGRWRGLSYYNGMEGCGQVDHYFPLGDGRVLQVEYLTPQALSGISSAWDLEEILRVPGAISGSQSDRVFELIMGTLELAPTGGWKTVPAR